jgi:hypothetical protein
MVIQRGFREIHEYLADAAVLSQGEDPVHYKKSLFNEAAGIAPEFLVFLMYHLQKGGLK